MHRQAELLAEDEVLLAAARGDVDDPGALRRRDLVPVDDAVGVGRSPGARRRRTARVPEADQRSPGELLEDLELALLLEDRSSSSESQ